MFEYIQPVVDWYMENINYWTVALLMFIESSCFIPFPSEVVVPPAAWKASEGLLNIEMVVFAGTVGALIGAQVNYLLGRYLGRPLIYKFADTRVAHFCLINREKVEKAEKFFVDKGNVSTFVGRLIPGVRQLISLPAGMAKMNFWWFSLYTFLGAGIWNIILAELGYLAHGQMDLIKKYSSEISWVLLGLGVLFVAYLVYNGLKKKTND